MLEVCTFCTCCGRPCGDITYDDGRCESCGPAPLTPEEKAEMDAAYEAEEARRWRLGLLW